MTYVQVQPTSDLFGVLTFFKHTHTPQTKPPPSPRVENHTNFWSTVCLLHLPWPTWLQAYEHKPPIRTQLCLQQRQCHCNANAPANI